MALDPELVSVLKRYTVVGVVLAGAVIWTVLYVQDDAHANGAPIVLGADAGPTDTPDAPPDKAPSLKEMFVGDRVACEPACRLEAYCSLRSVDDCLRTSCDGALRIAVPSDTVFARADDCAAAAAAPCADACARRATCSETAAAVDQARCVAACKEKPDYRLSRCVIEATTCDDVSRCKPSL